MNYYKGFLYIVCESEKIEWGKEDYSSDVIRDWF